MCKYILDLSNFELTFHEHEHELVTSLIWGAANIRGQTFLTRLWVSDRSAMSLVFVR